MKKCTTQEQFLVNAKQVHGNKYDYSKVEYINSKTKVKIVCRAHGIFWQKPGTHISGSSCPQCAHQNRANVLRLSVQGFLAQSRKIHGNKYDYSKVEYKNSGTKVEIVCPDHGSFWQSPNAHTRGYTSGGIGSGCPDCGGKKKLTTQEFLTRAKTVHGNKYDYSKVEYKGAVTKVTILCPEHGSFWQTPLNHLQQHGCPSCARTTRSSTRTSGAASTFVGKARAVHGSTYDYTKVKYQSADDKVKIICRKHGDFDQTPGNHLSGHGCPSCVPIVNVSSQEHALHDFLGELGVAFKTSVRGLLPHNLRQEVDIFLPKQKLAIEVDGIYWHSEANGKGRNYHYQKTVHAKRQGIQLLHFWDFEVEQKPDLVRSMIQQKIGLSRRLFARKLLVDAEVPSAEAREFLVKNHLQGSVNSKLRYGLRAPKSGKLACLMTFGASRFDKSGSMELLRFASAQGITVVGGASRLLAAFRKDHPTETLVSYADLRHSQGNLYKQLGFKLSHRSSPNYFWFGQGQRLPRYRTQKHKLGKILGDDFDPSLSAVENMQRAGFSRVFDCGNLVFNMPRITPR